MNIKRLFESNRLTCNCWALGWVQYCTIIRSYHFLCYVAAAFIDPMWILITKLNAVNAESWRVTTSYATGLCWVIQFAFINTNSISANSFDIFPYIIYYPNCALSVMPWGAHHTKMFTQITLVQTTASIILNYRLFIRIIVPCCVENVYTLHLNCFLFD